MRWVDAASAPRTHGRTDLRGPLKCSESPAVRGSASILLLSLTSTSRPRRRRALATVSPPMPVKFGGGWRLSPQSRLGATARFDGSVRPIDRPIDRSADRATPIHVPAPTTMTRLIGWRALAAICLELGAGGCSVRARTTNSARAKKPGRMVRLQRAGPRDLGSIGPALVPVAAVVGMDFGLGQSLVSCTLTHTKRRAWKNYWRTCPHIRNYSNATVGL